MSETSRPLRIDIVSDIVCPWCIIGYRQLKAAVDTTGIAVEIHWRPFELNPDMAAEGENIREHVARKYGSTAEQSKQARENLKALGDELGFHFNFADDMRIVNTFDAHQLIHWAQLFELAHDLKMALFDAYFSEQKNISDREVLLDIAQQLGLDREQAQLVLAEQRYATALRDELNYWPKQGIQGVPAVIFDSKHLVTGAQGSENYSSYLKQVIASKN